MEDVFNQNYAELAGKLTDIPMFSHETRGDRFFILPVAVQRLSGTYDIIKVQCREAQLLPLQLNKGSHIHVFGQIRSHNNKSQEGPKLIVTVFAKSIQSEPMEDRNDVLLHGTICKQPVYRRTPLGREICDFMLAVNRKYGRSDYIPCITWGIKAREAAGYTVGTELTLSGRFQSRSYIKIINALPVEKTAYEVSVIDLEVKKLPSP